ncbi:MAG: flavin reductase [Bacteroidetes bacterium]|nr:flavin reductase [Bacteroidota bacterium]
MDFKEISPFEINNNFFIAFDKDWALLCAGNPNVETESNMMTVSWGGIGILWNKPIAVCYIRPQRYTLDFVNKTGRFSLNFFNDNSHRDALNICGSTSGRDINKFVESKLTLKNDKEYACINEADLILNCNVLYVDELKENNFTNKEIVNVCYPKKDFHKIFIGEIVSVLKSM